MASFSATITISALVGKKNIEYSISLPTAKAELPGKVQGVVVQASKLIGLSDDKISLTELRKLRFSLIVCSCGLISSTKTLADSSVVIKLSHLIESNSLKLFLRISSLVAFLTPGLDSRSALVVSSDCIRS